MCIWSVTQRSYIIQYHQDILHNTECVTLTNYVQFQHSVIEDGIHYMRAIYMYHYCAYCVCVILYVFGSQHLHVWIWKTYVTHKTLFHTQKSELLPLVRKYIRQEKHKAEAKGTWLCASHTLQHMMIPAEHVLFLCMFNGNRVLVISRFHCKTGITCNMSTTFKNHLSILNANFLINIKRIHKSN